MNGCSHIIILHIVAASRGVTRILPRWAVILCSFWLPYCAVQNIAVADALPPFKPEPRKLQLGGMVLSDPGERCRVAVAAAGRQYGIPDHVMSAIALVESGRKLPDGRFVPWPWSINVAGQDHIFESREAAIASVRQFQASGVKSIDVGCMQVNLMHHPDAFAALEQGFDPAYNAAYAARFLHDLFVQTGSWGKAIANYHSATPELGEPYRVRVMQVMAQEGHNPPAPQIAAATALPAAEDAQAAASPPSNGPFMLGNRSELAKMLPQASGTVGHGLEAYRARPVRLAGRPS